MHGEARSHRWGGVIMEIRIITLKQCSDFELAWGSMLDIFEQLTFVFIACDSMREYPNAIDENVMFSGLAFIMEDILKKIRDLIDKNQKAIEKIYEQPETAT